MFNSPKCSENDFKMPITVAGKRDPILTNPSGQNQSHPIV
jgi:hypothetical protein